MSWPCPDCGEPFVPNHMCYTLRALLARPDANLTWPWLARVLMLEADRARQAFLVEQSLRAQAEPELDPHQSDRHMD